MNHENWKIVVLKHDRASEQIAEVISELFPDMTEVMIINNNVAWFKDDVRKEIRKSVKADKKQKVLTLYGCGSRHQFTYGLCREVADERSDGYTYIHFDHHTDYGSGVDRDRIDCGGFVQAILEDSNAHALRHVGRGMRHLVDLNNPYLSHQTPNVKKYDYILEEQLMEDGLKKVISGLLQGTPNDVYISMDLDVLHPSEIKTSPDYSRGVLRLEELKEALDTIGDERNIISADVVGYWTKENGWDTKSLLTYVEIAEKITGHTLDKAVKAEILEKIRKRYDSVPEESTTEKLGAPTKTKRIYEMLKRICGYGR